MRVSMIEGGLAENESRIIAAESGMLSALNLAEDRTRSSIEGLTQKLEAGQRETALRIGTAEGGLGEIESRISAAEARLALDRAEAARLAAEVNRVESETKKAIAVHLQEQTRAMDEMQIRMLRMERRIRPQIPEDDVTDGAAEKGAAAPASKAGGNDPDENRADPMRGFDYFMFELRFRGSTEEVKRKQAPYLGLFLGRKNVIDLGCGRGEFLELMKENHVPAVGVDMNPDMVDYCRLRRLRVVLGDMMTHLAAQPDESIDGIFVSQVVEHLTPSAVMDLIELCGNKMTDGGVIVVETINPSCFEAMLNFYTDPTHVRPIPAGLLRFMFEQGRFKVESVLFNAPINPEKMAVQLVATGAFPAEAGSYLDYAVHAVKR